MDNTLYPIDKELSTLEILTYYLNMFKNKVVSNLIDVQHYEYIKSVNPEYKTVNQMGAPVTVDQLLENNKNGVIYARENVARVEALIVAEKEGKFADLTTDVALGRLTIQDVLGKEA